MYEAIQKAWSSSNWDLASNILGFPQVQSMCGTLATGVKASNRYAGKPRSECNQERRYINSSKANGRQGLDRKKQPKCRDERAGKLWPYRKDKARKPSRLQPVRTLYPLSCDMNKLDVSSETYKKTNYMGPNISMAASPTESNPAKWRRIRQKN